MHMHESKHINNDLVMYRLYILYIYLYGEIHGHNCFSSGVLFGKRNIYINIM